MDEDVAIRVESVSKDFVLPHEKVNSIKSLFTGAAKRKGKRESKETQHALKDISFDIKQGEFFGIVGRNGSGKSTLLKILAGIYQPTEGKVYTKGKLVPFIELGVGFNPELTGRENVYLNGAMLGFSESEVEAMYDSIVKFAELERFMDQKLKNYSSGMQVRLAFSMAIRAEADILLIDEVLAVGDADFQRKCYEYFKSLKKNKTTVVFVSHDMEAVREFCDRALLLEDSKIATQGKTEKVAESYSKLFMEGNEEEEATIEPEEGRWGNRKIGIESAQASLKDDEVLIVVKARVRSELDHVIYGLHINGQDGMEVTAMNNRMLNQQDIKGLKPDQEVELTWTVLNIFNDGKYFVTITLVNETGVAYDWFVNACSFRVKRAQRSTTTVLSPTKVKIKII